MGRGDLSVPGPRITHVVSGGEYGWRVETWPDYFPDSLPGVVDTGPSSPTGVLFGYGAKFPAKYQNAFYALDWTYGIVYAVHLKPEGASYSATYEKFAQGPELPVTDAVIGKDGAMYLITGGRKGPSKLLRIRYVGEEAVTQAKPKPMTGAAAALHAERRALELLHQTPDKRPTEAQYAKVLKKLIPRLASKDRFVRFAARTALEHIPPKLWVKKALGTKNPLARIEVVMAAARTAGQASPGIRAQIQKDAVGALLALNPAKLGKTGRLNLTRAYGLTFLRLGAPSDDQRLAIAKSLMPGFPAKSRK